MEVGCRVFFGMSTQVMLRKMEASGWKLKEAAKDLAEKAKKASFWLWLRRKDSSLGKDKYFNNTIY